MGQLFLHVFPLFLLVRCRSPRLENLLMLLPPVNSQGSFFSRPVALAAAHSGAVYAPHTCPPVLSSRSKFFARRGFCVGVPSVSPPAWCGNVAVPLHTFFLKALVLARGLETDDALVVALAVTGPDILDAVHDRLLSGSVMPLVSRILYGVPLLLFLSWRIHGPVRSTVPSTRRPTRAIFEMDTESAGSAWPRLDGFSSVGQFGRGSYGNKHG